jgi:hypothetical protein
MVLEAKVVFQPPLEYWYSLATSTLCIAGPELTRKTPSLRQSIIQSASCTISASWMFRVQSALHSHAR